MYVLSRKVGQSILIDSKELCVKQLESKNMIVSIDEEVYDFDETDSFLVGGCVEIKALAIGGSSSKIGVDAPTSVSIERKEAPRG